MQFISGTVEGNDARAVMWECYKLERTSIPLWSHYSDGTKLQLEDVLSHCTLPYEQQIGYFEIQRKALQLALSQH